MAWVFGFAVMILSQASASGSAESRQGTTKCSHYEFNEKTKKLHGLGVRGLPGLDLTDAVRALPQTGCLSAQN